MHHARPTFRALVDEFLAEKRQVVEAIQFVNENGVDGAVLSVEWAWLATEFIEYHRARARFQMLHPDVHRTLPGPDR